MMKCPMTRGTQSNNVFYHIQTNSELFLELKRDQMMCFHEIFIRGACYECHMRRVDLTQMLSFEDRMTRDARIPFEPRCCGMRRFRCRRDGSVWRELKGTVLCQGRCCFLEVVLRRV